MANFILGMLFGGMGLVYWMSSSSNVFHFFVGLMEGFAQTHLCF